MQVFKQIKTLSKTSEMPHLSLFHKTDSKYALDPKRVVRLPLQE